MALLFLSLPFFSIMVHLCVNQYQKIMGNFFEQFWGTKLRTAAKAFEKNGFDVTICQTVDEARLQILQIIEQEQPKVVSMGDSMSLRKTGVLKDVMAMEGIRFINGFDKEKTREERMALRREALMCDLFMTGVNAMTAKGQLVWLDMIGNRIAPVAFGPQTVVLVAGRNKLTPNLDEAMSRIRSYAAPLNAIKHTDFKTPCQTTATCHDCSSPDRICNSWLIMEKSFPVKRVKLILVDEDLGL